MPHRLAQHNDLNAVGANPLQITARYRCACGTKEVLTIALMIDLNVPEEMFVWTMQRLLRDLRTEVEQHLEKAE